MTDVAPEQSMDEILHKVQREYAQQHKEQVQAPADVPRSAEVHDLNQASGGRKSRSGNRSADSPEPNDKGEEPAEATDGGERLISAATAGNAMAVLGQLAALQSARRRASEFRMGEAGHTVEDVLREALRPMLQAWLDEKLPGIAERLVQAELSRAMGEPG